MTGQGLPGHPGVTTTMYDMPRTLPERVLVVGGAGFVGSNIALDLCNAGCKVTVFDKCSHLVYGDKTSRWMVELRKSGLVGLGVSVFPFDVADFNSLRLGSFSGDPMMFGPFDAVVWAAGCSSVPEYRNEPADRFLGDMRALTSAVSHLRKGGRFVFLSSAAVNSTVHTMYGRSKFLQECFLRDCRDFSDIFVSILRPYNIVGGRMFNGYPFSEARSPETHVVPCTIDALFTPGKELKIHGDGSAVRDYVRVDKVCDRVRMALQDIPQNTIENVGTGYGLSTCQIVDLVLDVARGMKGLPSSVTERLLERSWIKFEAGSIRAGETSHLVAPCVVEEDAETGLREAIEDAIRCRWIMDEIRESNGDEDVPDQGRKIDAVDLDIPHGC